MKKIVLAAAAATAFLSAGEVNLNACKGCHGMNFEKSALGKSKKVSEMSQEEIGAALVGYKNGTYGAAMKGLMVGQVAKYSEEELKAAAAAIKGL